MAFPIPYSAFLVVVILVVPLSRRVLARLLNRPASHDLESIGTLPSHPKMSAFIDLKEMYSQTPPPFGRAMRKFWSLDPEYANLNNGSYGTAPKPVLQAALELSQEIEHNPDVFHRLTYQPRLIESRRQMAEFIGAHTDEVVLVTNATTGVNTILRNFSWDNNDLLIGFSTSYSGINGTLNYLRDVPPHPRKSSMTLTFPTTHEEILKQFRAYLKSPATQVGPNYKRVAVIDSIISNPGVLLPWKEMVKICKEENVWSVIDAAHSLGQELNINLGEVQPDFWFSNCHKWLFGQRSACVLYIPFRNQHIIKSTVPTSNFYIPLDDRNGDPNILVQFEWVGTINQTPYLTIPEALKFRKWLGGEDKINRYTHELALKGGRYLAELWDTQLMDPEGKYTLSMVNVELPVPTNVNYPPDVGPFVNEWMLQKEKAYSAWFLHNGKFWTRVSVQVFNDMDDFKHLGKAWLNMAKELALRYGDGKLESTLSA